MNFATSTANQEPPPPLPSTAVNKPAEAELLATLQQPLPVAGPELTIIVAQLLHLHGQLHADVVRLEQRLAALEDQIEKAEDIRAYDAAVAPGGPLLPKEELLRQIAATDPNEARYVAAALGQADYRLPTPDSTLYYATIPGIEGVWAREATLARTQGELASALHDWINFRRQRGLPIPR
ncbi:MAG: hypothetical protein M3Z04_05595 [Chloroflexota bacterium]|nr:hypothetical protein [Chloroflexota bacterium]